MLLVRGDHRSPPDLMTNCQNRPYVILRHQLETTVQPQGLTDQATASIARHLDDVEVHHDPQRVPKGGAQAFVMTFG
jgi:hypothetical protein